MLHLVVSMLLVMGVPTSASAKKDLWEMATSCVCHLYCQLSVHLDVGVTVTVSTIFPINVSVILALEAIPMKVVHQQLQLM